MGRGGNKRRTSVSGIIFDHKYELDMLFLATQLEYSGENINLTHLTQNIYNYCVKKIIPLLGLDGIVCPRMSVFANDKQSGYDWLLQIKDKNIDLYRFQTRIILTEDDLTCSNIIGMDYKNLDDDLQVAEDFHYAMYGIHLKNFSKRYMERLKTVKALIRDGRKMYSGILTLLKGGQGYDKSHQIYIPNLRI